MEFKEYEAFYNTLENNKSISLLMRKGNNNNFLKKEYIKGCEILNIEVKINNAIKEAGHFGGKVKTNASKEYVKGQGAKNNL